MTIHNVALYADVAIRIRHQLSDAVEATTPFYPTLAMVMDSNQESEDYDWLGQVPGMREWLGDRKFKQLGSYEFNIRNRDWEQSIQLPKKKIDDGRTGYFNNIAEMMAIEAAYHPDELLVELINAGQTTRCFDGQYFFDTDHEMGDSGVQSNLRTRTVADANNPTQEEIRTIVHQTMDDFLGFRGDNGKAIHRPTVTADLGSAVGGTDGLVFDGGRSVRRSVASRFGRGGGQLEHRLAACDRPAGTQQRAGCLPHESATEAVRVPGSPAAGVQYQG